MAINSISVYFQHFDAYILILLEICFKKRYNMTMFAWNQICLIFAYRKWHHVDLVNILKTLNIWWVASIRFGFCTKFGFKIAHKIYYTKICKVTQNFLTFPPDYYLVVIVPLNSTKPVDPSNFLRALKRKLSNLREVPFDFNTQQDAAEIL